MQENGPANELDIPSKRVKMAHRSTTPPLLRSQPQDLPSAKERKYDRQLRLWAASGQAALEKGNLLLLNSGAGVVGVETLKNLILPSIGQFTIVDEHVVDEKDLGVSFFLEESSLGKSRAKESCRLLCELNPEVKGQGIQESPQDFASNESALQNYSLIILVGPSPCLHSLSRFSQRHSIPFFYIQSIGFFSQFSVQLPDLFPIVDTHPDPNSTQDLRLLNPWPALVDCVYSTTKTLEELSDYDHGHVPYLLILLHFLDKWKAEHSNKPPSNYDEKKAFKASVLKGARTNNPEGGEENFDEASAAVLKSLNPFTIPTELRAVFDTEEGLQTSSKWSNFWFIVAAVKDFYLRHKVLPLPGSLPDMKARSADYIRLQDIYKSKAAEDLAEVIARVRELEQDKHSKTIEAVPDGEIETFCKNAAFVKLIRGRIIHLATITDPSSSSFDWGTLSEALIIALYTPEDSLLPIYIAFSAQECHHHGQVERVGVPPGSSRIVIAKAILNTIASKSSTFLESEHAPALETLQSRTANILKEFDRASPDPGSSSSCPPSELHNISALTGGMIAQEIIKVMTKQYIPVDNVCVFDGIGSRTSVFRL